MIIHGDGRVWTARCHPHAQSEILICRLEFPYGKVAHSAVADFVNSGCRSGRYHPGRKLQLVGFLLACWMLSHKWRLLARRSGAAKRARKSQGEAELDVPPCVAEGHGNSAFRDCSNLPK